MTDREIKNKIKNIADTVKITRAMQMVATTKIYGNQQKRNGAKAYLDDVEAATRIAMNYVSPDHPLFEENEGRSAYVVIAGDKGLCGDYNTQVLSYADSLIAKSEGRPKIFVIGYVGREYYKGKDCSLVGTYIHHQLNPTVINAIKMTDDLVEAFLKGNFKDLYLIYTEVNGMETKVASERLLPMTYAPETHKELYFGEENSDIFLKELLTAKIYYAVTSSALAVNCKRMVAMRQATINGEEIEEELNLKFHRSRQEKITNELNDAISSRLGEKR